SFFGAVPIDRRHRGNFIADKTNPIPRHYRQVLECSAGQLGAYILPRDNRLDATYLLRLAGVDIDDAGMGQRATENFSPECVRAPNVGGILRRSRYFAVAVLTH